MGFAQKLTYPIVDRQLMAKAKLSEKGRIFERNGVMQWSQLWLERQHNIEKAIFLQLQKGLLVAFLKKDLQVHLSGSVIGSG